jgi:putative addiction module component (TIGR02574 family)
MATTRDRVIEEALSLPADVRLSLVEKLLTSLNLPIDEETDRLWAEEAERRVSQIETGEVRMVPGEKVFSKIREKYEKWDSISMNMRKRSLIGLLRSTKTVDVALVRVRSRSQCSNCSHYPTS